MLRAVIAIAIVLLYFNNVITGALGIVLMVLAAIFLLTAFLGFCPLYLPFGLSTCKRK